MEILVQKEKGLGNAIKAGVKRASHDIVAVMDADGSHPVWPLLAALDVLKNAPGCEMVIGSRYGHGGRSRDRIPRRILSLFCTALTRLLAPCYVSDPLSGLVVARRRLFGKIEFTSGFKFGLFLLRYCKRHELLVGEIGFDFRPRLEGKSKTNLITGLRFIKDLLEARSIT